MQKLLLFICFLWPLYLSAQENIAYQSLKTEYVQFMEASINKSFDEQLQLWEDLVEQNLPEVYEQAIYKKGFIDDWQKSKMEKAKKSFPLFAELNADILNQFDIFESQIPTLLAGFASSYPDVDFQTVKVFALPSLMDFNGKVDIINKDGKEIIVVLFGVDFIAKLNQFPEIIPGNYFMNDLPTLVAHEFTHALHWLTSNIGEYKNDTPKTLLKHIWMEGIGAYHSKLLIPNTTFEYVLMDKNLAKECTDENVKQWASLFIKDVNSQKDKKKLYRKWFSARKGEMSVSRIGYCLGYSVIEKAQEESDISTLLRLSHQKAIPLAMKYLEVISDL